MNITRAAAAASIAIAALAVSACGGGASGKAADESPAPAADRALLDAAQRPLDRAHEVEGIEAARKGDLDKQIDSAAE